MMKLSQPHLHLQALAKPGHQRLHVLRREGYARTSEDADDVCDAVEGQQVVFTLRMPQPRSVIHIDTLLHEDETYGHLAGPPALLW